VYNDIQVWKQLLKDDFNWPPRRRGKGSKKLAKTKQEMGVAEYKAVYVQKFKELTPKDDEEVINLFKPIFSAMYIQYFGHRGVQNCQHNQVT